MSKELDYIADLERENKLVKSFLYCTTKSCNNCGKVKCENFQRQRKNYCENWVSFKDYITGYESKIADIKANCDLAIEGRDVKIMELEQQIEKMKRHCNCKHRDSEGYCEVKRFYLIDLSYDGCDKWELED